MDFVPLHPDCIPESLYLHYPLCKHHCSYCDFNVYTAQSQTADYANQWMASLDRQFGAFLGGGRGRLKTLYLGGGTPSLLSLENLKSLKLLIQKYFDWNEIEWTIECNPESLTREKLEAMKKLGINRLSLGVQTFIPEQLKRLERLATHEYIEKILSDVRELFENFSIDLMIGIADQTLESLEFDLKKLKDFSPPHISIYLLTLAADHKLKTSASMRDRLSSDELAAKIYMRVCDFLNAEKYIHYEVSNFSRPGFESRHNSNYWNSSKSYLGFGPGAHGYLITKDGGRIRYESVKDPKHWSESSNGIESSEILDSQQQRIEDLYLRLRHRRAVHLSEVNLAVASEAMKSGWLGIQNDQIEMTDAGWLIIESLAARLIP